MTGGEIIAPALRNVSALPAPMRRCVAWLPGVLVADRVGWAFVEHHHNVAAQGQLGVHGRFRREGVRVAVQVGLKDHPVLGDFAQAAQTEDLVAAGIGKDGARPRHETMQAAQARIRSGARAQIKMIGIGQQDPRIQFVGQFARRQAFYGGLRPHRHEDGSFDNTVGRMQQTGPGAGHRAFGLDLKRKLV